MAQLLGSIWWLDHSYVRDAALVHAVLSEVVNAPVEVKIGSRSVHGALDGYVAVQRRGDTAVGVTEVVHSQDHEGL